MRLLRAVLCACLAAGAFAPPVWAETYLWHRQFGDPDSFQWACGVGADSAGNVVLTGGFRSSMNFGGGSRPSQGNHDFYVAKYDRNGGYLWDREFGNDMDQYELFSAIDTQGNIILAGHFTWAVDLGGGQLFSAGSYDICVAKLDAGGNHLWSHSFGDGSEQRVRGVAVDAAGNVAVVGYFYGTVDFGGGPLTNADNQDIFLVEFDAIGNHLWSRRFGNFFTQEPEDVACDPAGNVLMTGSFTGSVDFGGGPLVSTALGPDIFVAKYDPSGTHLWSQRFGDSWEQAGRGIATDGSGNVIVTGEFRGAVDFGGGSLSSAGADDIFLVKFGPAGNHLWSQRFGDSSAGQLGKRVRADTAGNVVATGWFRGSANFGGGWLPDTGGYEDVYVAKFGPGGNHLWSHSYGDAAGQVQSWALALDPQGDALVAGGFTWTVNFGGGMLSSAGGWDVFLVKFGRVSSINVTTASPDSIGPDQVGSLDLEILDVYGARLGGRAADLRFTSTQGLVCAFGPVVENLDTTYTVGYTTCPATGIDTEVVSYASGNPPASDNLQLLVTHYPNRVILDVDPPRYVRPLHSIPIRASILNPYGARVPDERTAMTVTGLAGLGSVTSLVMQGDSSYTALYQAGAAGGFERLVAYDADAATIQRDSVTIEVILRPIVLSVLDIGNDQGRQVRVTWERDLHDAQGSGTPITEYVVWRRVDTLSKAGARVVPLAEMGRILDRDANEKAEQLLLGLESTLWEPVGPRVPGMVWTEYASVVPTLADSTVASGMHYSVFFVSAHTQSPQVFFISDPDSGYSLDNLAPAAPGNLAYSAPGWLSWDEAQETDFDYFSVYGSWLGTLDETAELLGSTTSTGMDIRAERYAYYFVTATDFAGNEGPAAGLDEPVAAGPAALPTVFALTAGEPTPFRSSTRIGFTAPERGLVRIDVYDAAGRWVKTLVDAAIPPGRHVVEWAGENAAGQRVPAGIYFCRLEAGDFRAFRKLVYVR